MSGYDTFVFGIFYANMLALTVAAGTGAFIGGRKVYRKCQQAGQFLVGLKDSFDEANANVTQLNTNINNVKVELARINQNALYMETAVNGLTEVQKSNAKYTIFKDVCAVGAQLCEQYDVVNLLKEKFKEYQSPATEVTRPDTSIYHHQCNLPPQMQRRYNDNVERDYYENLESMHKLSPLLPFGHLGPAQPLGQFEQLKPAAPVTNGHLCPRHLATKDNVATIRHDEFNTEDHVVPIRRNEVYQRNFGKMPSNKPNDMVYEMPKLPLPPVLAKKPNNYASIYESEIYETDSENSSNDTVSTLPVVTGKNIWNEINKPVPKAPLNFNKWTRGLPRAVPEEPEKPANIDYVNDIVYPALKSVSANYDTEKLGEYVNSILLPALKTKVEGKISPILSQLGGPILSQLGGPILSKLASSNGFDMTPFLAQMTGGAGVDMSQLGEMAKGLFGLFANETETNDTNSNNSSEEASIITNVSSKSSPKESAKDSPKSSEGSFVKVEETKDLEVD